MRKRDHYTTLGVKPAESPDGIRSAYRKLVKTHHPDLAGPESTRRFQEINEAYSVLSDPESRESYNRQLREDARRAERKTDPFPCNPRESCSEWLLRIREWDRRSISPFEWFFEDFFHESPGLPFSDTHRQQTCTLEVVLSPEEAARGGILPVPLVTTCSACTGRGFRGIHPCRPCYNRGWIQTGETVSVRIPPGIRHGSILEFPIAGRVHDRNRLRLMISVR